MMSRLDTYSTNLHMYRTLAGLGLICGLIIVIVYQFTQPLILNNKIIAQQNAINQLFPGTVNVQEIRLDESKGNKPFVVFKVSDEKQNMLGFAIPAQGMGYQDNIALLYGYRMDLQQLVGIIILESRETPGLGSRIETDLAFLKNFISLDVSLSSDLDQLQNKLRYVKSGNKKLPGEIDGISGASVSSKAVVDILQKSLNYSLPIIHQHKKELQFGPQAH